MAGSDRWYFGKEHLESTPSRKCGINADKELSYRQQAANLIQDMGQRLQVSQLCINTAIVYMHRFYMFHSFTKFHRNSISSCALFLAAKVEEQPRKLEHVIKVAHMCLHRETPALDVKSEAYQQQAVELVINENLMLQTLGFDIAVEHPHTSVVNCCQLVRASKDLAQTSYFMATNSLHLTTMCLQYRPTVVACVCIHLACKWSSWEIPRSSEGKDWFYYVDESVTLDLLEQLTSEFLAILDKCPSRLKRKILSGSGSTSNNNSIKDYKIDEKKIMPSIKSEANKSEVNSKPLPSKPVNQTNELTAPLRRSPPSSPLLKKIKSEPQQQLQQSIADKLFSKSSMSHIEHREKKDNGKINSQQNELTTLHNRSPPSLPSVKKFKAEPQQQSTPQQLTEKSLPKTSISFLEYQKREMKREAKINSHQNDSTAPHKSPPSSPTLRKIKTEPQLQSTEKSFSKTLMSLNEYQQKKDNEKINSQFNDLTKPYCPPTTDISQILKKLDTDILQQSSIEKMIPIPKPSMSFTDLFAEKKDNGRINAQQNELITPFSRSPPSSPTLKKIKTEIQQQLAQQKQLQQHVQQNQQQNQQQPQQVPHVPHSAAPLLQPLQTLQPLSQQLQQPVLQQSIEKSNTCSISHEKKDIEKVNSQHDHINVKQLEIAECNQNSSHHKQHKNKHKHKDKHKHKNKHKSKEKEKDRDKDKHKRKDREDKERAKNSDNRDIDPSFRVSLTSPNDSTNSDNTPRESIKLKISKKKLSIDEPSTEKSEVPLNPIKLRINSTKLTSNSNVTANSPVTAKWSIRD